jgi:hypothetical protein
MSHVTKYLITNPPLGASHLQGADRSKQANCSENLRLTNKCFWSEVYTALEVLVQFLVILEQSFRAFVLTTMELVFFWCQCIGLKYILATVFIPH